VDTPGYRVRDLSLETFQERLQDAIAARTAPNEIVSPGNARHDPTDPMRHVRESMKTILFLDGSNVGIEQQVTEIAKNQYLHNLAVSIMSSQFRLLQTAISERV
jgi:flagellar basal-body rod protein FlgB